MITNRRTLFLGLFIVLIPFIGLPTFWKTFIIIISGLTLISFSVNISIPKKITKRIPKRKETITPVFQESIINTSSNIKPRKEKVVEESVIEEEIIDTQ
ncbi:MAG: hypothetical protein ACYCZW_00335 [Minisyncoccota bacterium]